MACSCSSTSFASFAGASSSSCSFSSSSAATSLSFHQPQHQLPYLSCSSKHALLRRGCEKNTKQASFHFAVSAKQGQGPGQGQGQGHYDKAKKTSQRGGAGSAVKEEKASRKAGNSGGKNHSSYNSNPNPRSYNNNNNNSDPKSYNSSSRNRSRSMVALEVEDKDEDEEEDDDEDGSRRNLRFYNRNSENSRNSKSYNTSSVLRDEDEDEDEDDDDFDAEDEAEGGFTSGADDGFNELAVMPVPPAGFVLADDGSVSLMAPSHKRVTSLVDSETKLSLDCLIRRVFSSSDGRQCFLLCPLDTPVQILRIEDGDVLKEISDEELEDVFPTASYELAKRRLHLVHSGFCLTLRGGFCFSDDDVIDLNTVYGESGDNPLNEGVEVANFMWNGSEYLIFTPVEPLMFVSFKDNKTGELLIADDDLLDDEAVLDAIDEEKEFQAYMEEDSIMEESSGEEEEEG